MHACGVAEHIIHFGSNKVLDVLFNLLVIAGDDFRGDSALNTPPHFQRLGTKSARRMKCQGRSTAKKQIKMLRLYSLYVHPTVGNFAGCGEMGLIFSRTGKAGVL
jgi:hypothetical protein